MNAEYNTNCGFYFNAKCKFREIGILLRRLMNWETFVFPCFFFLFSSRPSSDNLVSQNSSSLLLYIPSSPFHPIEYTVAIKTCDLIDFYKASFFFKIERFIAPNMSAKRKEKKLERNNQEPLYLFLFRMCLLKMSEKHDSQRMDVKYS